MKKKTRSISRLPITRKTIGVIQAERAKLQQEPATPAEIVAECVFAPQPRHLDRARRLVG